MTNKILAEPETIRDHLAVFILRMMIWGSRWMWKNGYFLHKTNENEYQMCQEEK